MPGKRIDTASIPEIAGSTYPAPFDQPCRGRRRKRLGDAAGLTQFGVNLLVLEPGAWSSQRHWHRTTDEFVYILEGEVVLVTDAGEEVLRAGDSAGFTAGDADGHHLQNRSRSEARILEMGTRTANDSALYPDIDLAAAVPVAGKATIYSHRDGTPYPVSPRR